MNHARSTSKSQLFAAGITFTAIALLLAPLRPGPSDMQTQHASFIPILAASGVAETVAFRRLASVRPTTASSTPQVRLSKRHSVIQVRPQAPQALVRYDFGSPRVAWQHLGTQTRRAIDAAIDSGAAWKVVEIHGSSLASEGQLDRIHRLVRGSSGGHPYQVTLDSGHISFRTPEKASDTLHLCFLGDFHTQAPSPQELAAFDELLDYLMMKLGALEVRAHSRGTQSCLGAAFPAGEIIRAFGTTP